MSLWRGRGCWEGAAGSGKAELVRKETLQVEGPNHKRVLCYAGQLNVNLEPDGGLGFK